MNPHKQGAADMIAAAGATESALPGPPVCICVTLKLDNGGQKQTDSEISFVGAPRSFFPVLMPAAAGGPRWQHDALRQRHSNLPKGHVHPILALLCIPQSKKVSRSSQVTGGRGWQP